MEAEDTREWHAGGELNAAIARSAVRMRSRYAGRGPTRARAFHHDNLVVVIMQNTMTTMETSLVAAGKTDAVLELRHEVQDAIRRTSWGRSKPSPAATSSRCWAPTT